MKFRTDQTYIRIGSLFTILALFVAVNACRTVEPESPEIEDEESFDEPVAETDDQNQQDTSWEDLGEQDDQDASQLDSPDDTSTSGSAPVKTTHKVKPGESLWDIASKYYDRGIYWRAIRDHNNLSQSGQINAGQTLEIPELSSQRKQELRQMAADKSGGSTSGGSASASGSGMYVTKKGDTFWKIAEREYGNGEQWKRIWRANKSKVPNPDKLKAGTKIRIPGKSSGGSSGKGGGSAQKGGQKGSN